MKIYLASDHAGIEMKDELISFLAEHDIEDVGAYKLEPEDDYPDYVIPLAKKVAEDEGSMGIVIGGSGQGEAIAANRIKGARCALYNSMEGVKLSREHNNANIISLGARLASLDEAKEAVVAFISTPFSGDERHVRRIKKLDND